jgi:hypothetical protein
VGCPLLFPVAGARHLDRALPRQRRGFLAASPKSQLFQHGLGEDGPLVASMCQAVFSENHQEREQQDGAHREAPRVHHAYRWHGCGVATDGASTAGGGASGRA